MKKFKTIAIHTSLKSKKVEEIIFQLFEIFESEKIKPVLTEEVSLSKSHSVKSYKDKWIIDNCDTLFSIGGDGTLLGSARRFGVNKIPILGINLGNLGFLTDIAPEKLTLSMKEILKGEYLIDERAFLGSKINNQRSSYTALNEVVIHSGTVAKMIEYELFIDESFVYRQKSDGLIISTSTGSTAYSLSGNGSIVHPNVSAFTILPMFPHSLNARALLINEESIIRICLTKKTNAKLSFDSQNTVNLKKGDIIEVFKSEANLKLLHPVDHDFFSACRNKLGWSLGFFKNH